MHQIILDMRYKGKKMAKFYFITGGSGSGKSTIIPDLKKILGNNYVVYDFDSIGVPKNADKKWRQETTEKWLRKLLQDNKDACLLGQMVLGELLACPSAKQIASVNFCLLDVSDYERITRLKNSNIGNANQYMLNWSAWLRMHHQDPQWEQHVIKDDCWHGLNFSEWDKLDHWNSKATVKIIDTTGLNIINSAEAVAQWVNEKKKE